LGHHASRSLTARKLCGRLNQRFLQRSEGCSSSSRVVAYRPSRCHRLQECSAKFFAFGDQRSELVGRQLNIAPARHWHVRFFISCCTVLKSDRVGTDERLRWPRQPCNGGNDQWHRRRRHSSVLDRTVDVVHREQATHTDHYHNPDATSSCVFNGTPIETMPTELPKRPRSSLCVTRAPLFPPL
jgi:hypothetical protein